MSNIMDWNEHQYCMKSKHYIYLQMQCRQSDQKTANNLTNDFTKIKS